MLFIQSDGWLYSRWNNPTTDAASQTLNNLEGGYGTLLFSSGMAAVSTAFMAMLKSGDHVVRVYTLIERFLNDQGSKLATNWSHMRLDFWLCA